MPNKPINNTLDVIIREIRSADDLCGLRSMVSICAAMRADDLINRETALMLFDMLQSREDSILRDMRGGKDDT